MQGEKLSRLKASRQGRSEKGIAAQWHLSSVPHEEADAALLQAEHAQLAGANDMLRQRLQESLAELQLAKEQLGGLRRVQQRWESELPNSGEIVEAALCEERARQEARNRKALNLLRSKDEVIQSYKARYLESSAEAGQLRQALQAAQNDLESEQARIQGLADAQRRLRAQLEGREAEAAHAQAELQARRPAAPSSRQQLLGGGAHDPPGIEAGLRAALAERDEQLAQQGREMAGLQRYLSKMLGLRKSDIPLLAAAAAGALGGSSDAEQRLAQLAAANERLEYALVHAHHHRHQGAPGTPSSADPALDPALEEEDRDAVVALAVQLAASQGQLAAATERLADLEPQLRAAQAELREMEARLEESLVGREALESEVQSLAQQAEAAEGAAVQLSAQVTALALAQQQAQAELDTARQREQAQQQQRTELLAALEAAQSQLTTTQQAAAEAQQAAASEAASAQELRSVCEEKQRELGAAEAWLQDLERACAGAETAAAEERAARQAAETDLVAAQQRLQGAAEQLSELRSAASARESEVRDLQEMLGAGREAQRQWQSQGQQVEMEMADCLSALGAAQSELAHLRSTVYSAVHAARLALSPAADPYDGASAARGSALSGPENLQELVTELAVRLQEQRRVSRELRQLAEGEAAKAASVGPGGLEASQRAVIRSLTWQLAVSERQAAKQRSERGARRAAAGGGPSMGDSLRRLQVGLGSPAAAGSAPSTPTLAAGLFDAASPGLAPAARPCLLEAAPDALACAAPAAAMESQGFSVDASHVAGMFALLTSQLHALDRAQQQLAAFASASAAGAWHEGGLAAALHQAAVSAAAALTSELPAMQATLHVASVDVQLLLQRQEAHEASPSEEGQPADEAAPVAASAVTDAEVRQLREALRKVGARRERWRQRCAALQARLNDLQGASRAVAGQLRAAEAEAAEAAAGQRAAEAQLEAAAREAQEGSQASRALIEEQVSVLTDIRRRAVEAEAALADAQRRAADAEAALELERQQRRDLDASLSGVADGLRSSAGVVETAESQLMQLGQRLAVLTAAHAAAVAEGEQRQQAIAAAQAEAAGLRREKGALVVHLDSMRGLVAELEGLLERTEQMRGRMEEGLGRRLAALEAELRPEGEEATALDALLSAGDDLTMRMRQLEAVAAEVSGRQAAAAVERWGGLTRGLLSCAAQHQAVAELREGLQRELRAARRRGEQLAADVEALRRRLEAALTERRQLEGAVDAVRAHHEQERQTLAELHVAELAEMARQAQREREELLAAANAQRLRLRRQGEAMARGAEAGLAGRIADAEARAGAEHLL